MCLFFKLGIGPCFYLIRMQRKDLNQATGYLQPRNSWKYTSWKLLIMKVGVGGPFATFLFLTKIKVEILSEFKKEAILKLIHST